MKLICAATILVANATPTLAQDAPLIGPEALKVFPRGLERGFAAKVGGKYRKTHPGQTLTQFWLYRQFRQNRSKEDPGQTPGELIAEDVKPDTPGWADVLAAFSGLPGSFRQTVACHDREKGGLNCLVECDDSIFRLDASTMAACGAQ